METEIIKIDPRKILLLKQNARYMETNEYEQLVNNIKKDRKLTSVPFCYKNENDEIEVLSGNHRVMASIDAGIKEIDIMLCKEKLSKDQCIAIQLSHNSIIGKDDEVILKQLYNQIQTVDFKEYSGITDDFISFCKETEKNFKTPLLSYQNLNLLFLPTELNEIKDVLNKIEYIVEHNNTIITNFNDYDNYLNISTNISKCLNIKNPSTIFKVIIQIVSNHLDEIKNISYKNNEITKIPFSVILNKNDIDKNLASIIDGTLSSMVNEGLIKKDEKEKGLVVLCENYLKNKKLHRKI